VDAKRAPSWAEKGKEIGEWHGKRHISAVKGRRWGRVPGSTRRVSRTLDRVAKVENRTTPKFSRIFGLLCCCLAL